jgi:hypothetical protein
LYFSYATLVYRVAHEGDHAEVERMRRDYEELARLEEVCLYPFSALVANAYSYTRKKKRTNAQGRQGDERRLERAERGVELDTTYQRRMERVVATKKEEQWHQILTEETDDRLQQEVDLRTKDEVGKNYRLYAYANIK